MKSLRAALWIFGLVALLANGCGYRFAGGGDLPAGVRLVHVEIMENRTSETGIETTLTNDLIYEFVRSEKAVVTRKERAEAILSGVIKSSHTTSIAHSSQTSATARRVYLVADLFLTTPEGERLWSARNISANEDYAVDASKLVTEENKREAIKTLIKRLAEKIYRRMSDQF